MFSTGFSLGARDGRKIGVMLSGTLSLPVVCHPALSSSRSPRSDVARDLVEVELHHVGVGIRQRKRRADAAGRADRAEQISVVIALVGGLPWPRSAPGPLPKPGRSSGRCGPRPQTRFRPASSPAVLRDGPSARAGSFFESLDDPLILSRMTGRRADVGEAESLQKLADTARMKVDAEPLGDDAFEVDPTPAYDAVLLTIRTGFDDLRQLSQLLRRKARLGTLAPVVDQALRTRRVEAMNPVAQRLAVHCPRS